MQTIAATTGTGLAGARRTERRRLRPVMSDDQANGVSVCAGSAGGVRGPVSMP